MKNQFYSTFSSPFRTFTIVWRENTSQIQLERIFLSDLDVKSEGKALKSFKFITLGKNPSIDLFAEKIQRFFEGKIIEFDLKILNFNRCYEIQKRVLLAEYQIPRGCVSTYKRIADYIGLKNGARVVGNALAKNPFPIIIPCHRAIKTNGEIGGFQGGFHMKCALLRMEGIDIINERKVNTNKIFY